MQMAAKAAALANERAAVGLRAGPSYSMHAGEHWADPPFDGFTAPAFRNNFPRDMVPPQHAAAAVAGMNPSSTTGRRPPGRPHIPGASSSAVMERSHANNNEGSGIYANEGRGSAAGLDQVQIDHGTSGRKRPAGGAGSRPSGAKKQRDSQGSRENMGTDSPLAPSWEAVAPVESPYHPDRPENASWGMGSLLNEPMVWSPPNSLEMLYGRNDGNSWGATSSPAGSGFGESGWRSIGVPAVVDVASSSPAAAASAAVSSALTERPTWRDSWSLVRGVGGSIPGEVNSGLHIDATTLSPSARHELRARQLGMGMGMGMSVGVGPRVAGGGAGSQTPQAEVWASSSRMPITSNKAAGIVEGFGTSNSLNTPPAQARSRSASASAPQAPSSHAMLSLPPGAQTPFGSFGTFTGQAPPTSSTVAPPLPLPSNVFRGVNMLAEAITHDRPTSRPEFVAAPHGIGIPVAANVPALFAYHTNTGNATSGGASYDGGDASGMPTLAEAVEHGQSPSRQR